MGYTLYIAEKPSMGRAIADCLPGSKLRDKHSIEVGNAVVTWCVGHLLEMVEPEAYRDDWKRWELSVLPMIPEQFSLRPIKATSSQLTVIKRLLAGASSVVHAGDPGREGQMIVDEVLEYLKCKLPVKRLMLNATDPATIKKQLAKLEDNRKYAPVYAAATCRSQADWLVGMNLTRAATKSIADRDTLVSIGRVQTPTLALVVNRCKAIENFVPQTFYELEVDVHAQQSGSDLTLKHSPKEEQRIFKREDAQALAAQAKGFTGPLKVSTQRKKATPPKLYSLASLQGDASKVLKLGAAKTLALAQDLYTQGCLSYPRTECHYLPPEQKEQVPQIMDALRQAPIREIAETATAITDPQPRPAVFSAAGMKGEEHHAIIPTGKTLPPGITGPAADIYRLVAQRYLLSLCADYQYDETVVQLLIGKTPYQAKGQVPKVLGWKAHLREAPKETLLPPVTDGEDGQVKDARITQGKTSPPKYYTEGTLIADMGAVAKYVTEPAIKAILKETSGIGTSATQAETIETLKRREYITADKKGQLKDTPVGRSIIEHLPRQLTLPDITAKWETDLKAIALGQQPPDGFRESIRKFVTGGVQWFANREGQQLITGGRPRTNKGPGAGGTGRRSRAGTGRATARRSKTGSRPRAQSR